MKITNYKLQNTKLGFTLIEMLVVVSIIGILAALVTVSFSSTQKQARDTQRKSDLKQYQNALEAFANKSNGLYISWTTTINTSTLCSGLGLQDCPNDPKNASDPSVYFYRYQSDGGNPGTTTATRYVLWAKLENVSNMYWVVCSTGQSGKISTSTAFSSGACPAGLTP